MFGPFSRYVHPYRTRLLLGVAAITCAQVANTLIPVQIGAAVDTLTGPDDATLAVVQGHVLRVLALAVVVAIGGYAMRRLMGVASTWIEYDIRTAYFAHLLAQPLSFYQEHRTGDLMARATNDLSQVRIFFTYGLRGVAEMVLIAMMTSALLSETANPVLVLVGVRVPSVPAGTDDGMVVVLCPVDPGVVQLARDIVARSAAVAARVILRVLLWRGVVFMGRAPCSI